MLRWLRFDIKMDFTLKPARLADKDLTYRFKKEALQGYIEQIWGWDEQFQWDFHKQEFTSSQIQIIEYEGVPVGYLELEENERTIFIVNLLLIPYYQGKGIGSGLIRYLIQRAQQQNKELLLEVFKVNVKAKRLYERLGFETYQETIHHFRMKKAK